MKKIALIGSHGVGKTTTVYGLAHQFKKSRIDVSVLFETARQCPLPINQKGTVNSQLWILGQQMIQESTINPHVDYAICDRSVLDVYAYSYQRNPKFAKSILPFIIEHMKTYDYIFYLPVRKDYLKGDSLRSSDEHYQREIDMILRHIIKIVELHGIKIIPITNDKLVVERIFNILLQYGIITN